MPEHLVLAEEIKIDVSAVNAVNAVNAGKSAADGLRAGSLSTWAMLIQRVYEVDPVACPHCGAAMKIISFIECRQRDVSERILRHCGLWEGPLLTLASARSPPARTPQVLERIHGSSFRTAESIGPSARPVPDDDRSMKRNEIRQ
jgi:hypothetical protein